MSSRPRITFGFVPMPLEIWDDKMDFSCGEFWLLGYLLRRVQFGKAIDKISDREVLAACPLSRNTFLSARDSLVNRGWLKINISGNTKSQSVSYELQLAEQHPIVSKIDNNENSLCQTLTTIVSKTDTIPPLIVSKIDTIIRNRELKTENPEGTALDVARGVLDLCRFDVGIRNENLRAIAVAAKFELDDGVAPEVLIPQMAEAWKAQCRSVPDKTKLTNPAKFFGVADKWKSFIKPAAAKTDNLAERIRREYGQA